VHLRLNEYKWSNRRGWPEKDRRPVACKWFLIAVLSREPALEKIVRAQQDQSEEPPEDVGKKCVDCGKPYYPTSNRQQYCLSCGRENERRKANARRRKAYEKSKDEL